MPSSLSNQTTILKILQDATEDARPAACFGQTVPTIFESINNPESRMETLEFPTAVIASLASGISFCEFGKIHEAAEYLMGHQIWTRDFASNDLLQSMRDKVLDQCPGMFAENDGSVNKDNWQAKLAEIEAEIGPVCVIRKGCGKTAMHPLEGIQEGKPTVILVKTT